MRGTSRPASRRKVEWALEGPGTIVAADDGGLLFDRGKIDEGKYAQSTTHSFEKKIGRKTKNPDDDFTVKAGQSWAVISSAVENDPDTEVKKKAVFALSQLDNDEGVPLLIDQAKRNPNPVVRKEAIFWLGQSEDRRAVEFITSILEH